MCYGELSIMAGQTPPAQPLFLAFGQKVFGHPWCGVLLSVGIVCACISWMLASADLRVSGDAVLGRSVRRAWYLDELLLGRRSARRLWGACSGRTAPTSAPTECVGLGPAAFWHRAAG